MKITGIIATVLFAIGTAAASGWEYTTAHDEFDDSLSTMFVLKASNTMTDGIGTGVPELSIVCGMDKKGRPQLNAVMLSLPVALGQPDRPPNPYSYYGRPGLNVHVRQDSKIWWSYWQMGENRHMLFVAPYKATRWSKTPATFLKNWFDGVKDLRMEFRDASSRTQVAVFDPSGLDWAQVAQACGEANLK